jgi:hypothetical protein
MPETPTTPDLEKAHVILSEFGLLIGPAGELSDLIARAIAAGIALGRKEALAGCAAAVRAKAAVNLLKPVSNRFSAPTLPGLHAEGRELHLRSTAKIVQCARLFVAKAEEPTWQTRHQPEKYLFQYTGDCSPAQIALRPES